MSECIVVYEWSYLSDLDHLGDHTCTHRENGETINHRIEWFV